MQRVTWIAVLLLIASNTAWCITWFGGDGLTVDPASIDHRSAASADDATGEAPHGVRQPSRAGDVARDAEAAAGLLLPGEEVADGDAILRGRTDAAAPGEGAMPGAAPAETPEAREARERQKAAVLRATTTMRKIAQVKDAAVRQEGLAELTDALSGSDSLDVEYALSVLYQLPNLGLDLDLGAFQSLVLSHLDSESPGVRRNALYVLRAMEPDGADIRLALSAADDPDPTVRSHATRLLRSYSGGKLEREAADAIVKLLSDEDDLVRRGALRGFWGASAGPTLQQALVELATQPERRYEVVEHALTPLQNKSRDVVDALFVHLTDDDRRIRLRSHWGLQRGISEDLQPYVAKRYAGHLEEFLNPKTQREALQLIAKYGDENLAPQVQRFAENALVSAKIRELAQRAAAYLTREKPAR